MAKIQSRFRLSKSYSFQSGDYRRGPLPALTGKEIAIGARVFGSRFREMNEQAQRFFIDALALVPDPKVILDIVRDFADLGAEDCLRAVEVVASEYRKNPLQALATSNPHIDIMGVLLEVPPIEGVEGGESGRVSLRPVEVPEMLPEAERLEARAAYFYRVLCDKIKLGALMPPGVELEEVESTLTMLEECKEKAKGGILGGQVVKIDLGGIEWEVYPHGGQNGYKYLLRSADADELRVFKGFSNLPDVSVSFGAKFCMRYSYGDACQVLRKVCRELDLPIEAYKLYALDAKCDVPASFVEVYPEQFQGYGARAIMAYPDGRTRQTTGFSNLLVKDPSGVSRINQKDKKSGSGQKEREVCIYDKRNRAQGEPHWLALWQRMGIEKQVPVWRVEVRFRREYLTDTWGVDAAEDLTAEKLSAMWRESVTDYMYLCQAGTEKFKRKEDRKVHPEWQKIQSAGVWLPRPSLDTDKELVEGRRLRQGAGCIASEMVVAGVQAVRAEFDRIIDMAFGAALEAVQADVGVNLARALRALADDVERIVADSGEVKKRELYEIASLRISERAKPDKGYYRPELLKPLTSTQWTDDSKSSSESR